MRVLVLMAVSMVMRVRVRMAVVVAAIRAVLVARIGAALRPEGPLDRNRRSPEPTHHLGEHVVV
ncbi:MAG TPA: hypothetical protein VGO82_01995, partial [Enterovirga sp.]|nr:hypothetical protein [Enterovirga sp.]